MRFLTDQDVYAVTTRLLVTLGHDVVTASSIGQSQAPDSQLLETARQQDRILVTRDRDFGSLVFLQNLRVGVIYLRISPSTLNSCHRELEGVLLLRPEEQLSRCFTVIEPGRHRIRRLPA